MRIAVWSESEADEAVVRLLVDGVLDRPTLAPIGIPDPAQRGFEFVARTLEATIRTCHYYSDADGLVIVVDSNHTSLDPGHPKSRYERFRNVADTCLRGLKSRGGQPPLRVAIGVAMPAIEAWLLAPEYPEIHEAAWERGLVDKRDPYTKMDLKRRLLGGEFTGGQLRRDAMVQAARRAVSRIPLLRERFPNGFGRMAAELRSWVAL